MAEPVPAGGAWRRLEPILAGLFLACWVVVLLARLGVVPLAGHLPLALYPLYSTAATLGWASGILYMRRRRGVPLPMLRRLFVVYYLGPAGILWLLRSMAPLEWQQAAPLVPLYAFGVFSALFSVPVFMKGPWTR
jgi:hypothetical protein